MTGMEAPNTYNRASLRASEKEAQENAVLTNNQEKTPELPKNYRQRKERGMNVPVQMRPYNSRINYESSGRVPTVGLSA